MIKQELINRIVSKIARKFDPDKIILFGSYASGIPNENSDLDLLIIKDTNEPIHCRDFHIRKYLIGTAVPMDIIVYTNTEYEEEKKNKYSFISSTLLTSKIVYERRK